MVAFKGVGEVDPKDFRLYCFHPWLLLFYELFFYLFFIIFFFLQIFLQESGVAVLGAFVCD